MRLPWVSREQYDAVLAERDRVIVALRAHISTLEQRLLTPIAVTVKLPDDLVAAQPAVLVRKRPKQPVKTENAEKLPPVNWEDVDPDNNAQIATIAAREIGDGPINAYAFANIVARIREHARTARAQKRARIVEKGTLSAVVPPSVRAIADTEPQDSEIPAEIRERIERAARGE